MRAYAVRSATPLPREHVDASKLKDARAGMMLREAGREVARAACVVLLSGYCAESPELLGSDVARALRVALFGSTDAARWTGRLQAALVTDEAVALAARLERHRAARRMTPIRFMSVLLGEL